MGDLFTPVDVDIPIPSISPNMDMVDGDLGTWGSWFRGISGAAVNAALGAYTYNNVIRPANGIPAIGPDGRTYMEGQRIAYPAPNGQMQSGFGGITSGTLLLVGAALVAVLLLKD